MASCAAWLLQAGHNRVVAAGERDLLQLMVEPETYPVPLAPRHLARVLFWQDRVLPVLDLGVLFDDGPTQASRFLAVVGYQARPDVPPGLGALSLAAAPVKIAVDDAQACPLPAGFGRWSGSFCSCFMRNDRAVPVLDLARLFA